MTNHLKICTISTYFLTKIKASQNFFFFKVSWLTVFPIQIHKLWKAACEFHNSTTSIYIYSPFGWWLRRKLSRVLDKMLISLIYLLSLCTYDVKYIIWIATRNISHGKKTSIIYKSVRLIRAYKSHYLLQEWRIHTIFRKCIGENMKCERYILWRDYQETLLFASFEANR